MNYTIFDPSTGEILYTIHNGNVDNNSVYVEGHYLNHSHYIDIITKQPIEKGNKPGINYTWNYNTKSWQANIDQDAANVRQQRNNLLSTIDRINPIWYASLTAEQQTELQTYRTALLNVPEQAGFPTDITWPSKPTWL